MPYFNRSAFAGMSLEEVNELESMAYRAELNRLRMLHTMPLNQYCIDNPYDSENCQGDDESVTTAGGDTSGSIYPTSIPTISVSNGLYMTASLTPENIAKYNLKKYDGGCTPPERSDKWKNEILTSYKYQFSAPSFYKFMITAFRKEGGCVNDPNDRGGYTCYGCASNGLCRGVDMKNISREKVEDLAYENIFRKYHLDRLPDAFRGYALWGMWGSGAVTGIKQFQATLGVPQTGQIDDATVYAAEHYNGDFAAAYTQNREQFLRNIVARDSSQRKFLDGWLRGLELLRPSGCHVVPTNPITR